MLINVIESQDVDNESDEGFCLQFVFNPGILTTYLLSNKFTDFKAKQIV